MLHDLLIKNIKKHVQLSDTEVERICNYFEPKVIEKRSFLLTQGSIYKYEGFVLEGCFRIFTTDKKGNENTLYFATKDWWLIDIDSFMNQHPSDLNIQALEDSKVLLIKKVDKMELYNSLPVVEKLFRIMSQKALVAWQRRLIRNHSLTAEERYHHFIQTYPEIASKLTDRQISSYLGITHEFLSKIKRKNTKTE
ncbi:Crp/Fnr family transcriptional regulator [Algibacter agarivorans]|uniref:Crp/Fnr family transcriptional regulator n=1 Tax=Algibacter agarivorans TaxID=1109741 RepID=A0ABP9GKT8_9FLAO